MAYFENEHSHRLEKHCSFVSVINYKLFVKTNESNILVMNASSEKNLTRYVFFSILFFLNQLFVLPVKNSIQFSFYSRFKKERK